MWVPGLNYQSRLSVYFSLRQSLRSLAQMRYDRRMANQNESTTPTKSSQESETDISLNEHQQARVAALKEARALLLTQGVLSDGDLDPADLADLAQFILDGSNPAEWSRQSLPMPTSVWTPPSDATDEEIEARTGSQPTVEELQDLPTLDEFWRGHVCGPGCMTDSRDDYKSKLSVHDLAVMIHRGRCLAPSCTNPVSGDKELAQKLWDEGWRAVANPVFSSVNEMLDRLETHSSDESDDKDTDGEKSEGRAYAPPMSIGYSSALAYLKTIVTESSGIDPAQKIRAAELLLIYGR